ncbi:hypothetical protein ES703_117615 [subsurface metagenome]
MVSAADGCADFNHGHLRLTPQRLIIQISSNHLHCGKGFHIRQPRQHHSLFAYILRQPHRLPVHFNCLFHRTLTVKSNQPNKTSKGQNTVFLFVGNLRYLQQIRHRPGSRPGPVRQGANSHNLTLNIFAVQSGTKHRQSIIVPYLTEHPKQRTPGSYIFNRRQNSQYRLRLASPPGYLMSNAGYASLGLTTNSFVLYFY